MKTPLNRDQIRAKQAGARQAFATGKVQFQQQFPAGARPVAKPPAEMSSKGCLTCLHQQIHRAKQHRDMAEQALADAKKFAEELAIKEPKRADDFAKFAESITLTLRQITEVDSLVASLPEEQGPGTELHKLLAELGFKEPPNCSCKSTMAWMNQICVEGCREEIDTIIAKLNEAKALVTWADISKGAWQAFMHFKSMNIRLLQPVRGLVVEAIRRADEYANGRIN